MQRDICFQQPVNSPDKDTSDNTGDVPTATAHMFDTEYDEAEAATSRGYIDLELLTGKVYHEKYIES